MSYDKFLNNTLGWKVITAKNFEPICFQQLPKQKNGWDCGIFTVMYFCYLTQSAKFDFEQQDLEKIRKWLFHILVLKYNTSVYTNPYIGWLLGKVEIDYVGTLKLTVSSRQKKTSKEMKGHKVGKPQVILWCMDDFVFSKSIFYFATFRVLYYTHCQGTALQ